MGVRRAGSVRFSDPKHPSFGSTDAIVRKTPRPKGALRPLYFDLLEIFARQTFGCVRETYRFSAKRSVFRKRRAFLVFAWVLAFGQGRAGARFLRLR